MKTFFEVKVILEKNQWSEFFLNESDAEAVYNIEKKTDIMVILTKYELKNRYWSKFESHTIRMCDKGSELELPF